MKRKKLEWSKKLFLNKETVSALTRETAHHVLGGDPPNGTAGCQSVYACPGSFNATCAEEPATSPVICHVQPGVSAQGETMCGTLVPTKISCVAGAGCATDPKTVAYTNCGISG